MGSQSSVIRVSGLTLVTEHFFMVKCSAVHNEAGITDINLVSSRPVRMYKPCVCVCVCVRIREKWEIRITPPVISLPWNKTYSTLNYEVYMVRNQVCIVWTDAQICYYTTMLQKCVLKKGKWKIHAFSGWSQPTSITRHLVSGNHINMS